MSGYFDPGSRSLSLSIRSLSRSPAKQYRSKTCSLPPSFSSDSLNRRKIYLPALARRESFEAITRYSSQPRRMTNTVRASNKAAILAVGEELRLLLHAEKPPIIKDRRYHFKAYEMCFVGIDMVDWLLNKGEVESRAEAVAMMQKLLETGVIHHVCDDHDFKDEKLFYRFRRDDGTYEEPPDTVMVAKGQRIYSRLRTDGSNLIQDRKFHLTTYKQCLVGKEFVDWLMTRGEANTREEAVEIGKQLLDSGVFRHVCDDHHFKDEFLFYRFRNDEPLKRKGGGSKIKKRAGSILTSSVSEDTSTIASDRLSSDSYDTASYNSSENINISMNIPSETEDDYIHMQSVGMGDMQGYVQMQPNIEPPSVKAPQLDSHQSIAKVTIEELLDPAGNYVERPVNVVSDPVGYGFVIRGSNPVYVHTVDPNGPAAAAGLQVGEYLHYVNDQQVLDMTHSDVARIILMGTSTAKLVTFIERDRLRT